MILYLFLFVCLFVSCSGISDAPEYDGLTVEKVLSYDDAEKRQFKYSDLFDSVSVIPLDTTGNFLLQDAVNVKYELGRIFVRDRGHRIFIFDGTGKGLGRIDRKGQGAHEYVHIESFDVSCADSLVCLFTFPSRLMYFDLDGNFLREQKIGVRGEDCAFAGPEKMAFFTDNLETTKERRAFQLELLDLSDCSTDGFLPGYRWLAGGTMPSFQQRRFFTSTSDGECLLTHPLSTHVYRISDEGVSVKYKVDFGNRTPVPERKDDYVAPEDVRTYLEKEFPVYGFNSCWENDMWFHVSAYVSGKLTDLLYDKRLDVLYDCGSVMADDMTEGMTFPVKAKDDCLVSFVNSGDVIGLEEYLKSRGKDKSDNPVYVELLDAARRYENPIICLYHFKK